MQQTISEREPASTTLCKACGLCCTGHLFITADLHTSEVEQTRDLGLNVLSSDLGKPVFSLPCPLWNGKCTIYTHPHKPSICGDFRCKLLREVEEGQLQLTDALTVVQRTKQLIEEMEEHIAVEQTRNFRKRLFEHLRQLEQATVQTATGNALRLQAGALLVLFAQRFGVTDLFNKPDQEKLIKNS